MTNEENNYGVEVPDWDNVRFKGPVCALVIHGETGYVIVPMPDMKMLPAVPTHAAEKIRTLEHSKWGTEWSLMRELLAVVGKDPLEAADRAFRDAVEAAKKAVEEAKDAAREAENEEAPL